MGGGSCTFQDRWLTDERFKSWLKRHPNNKFKAVCQVCRNKDFSVEKMGVSALVSHMNGKMHKSFMKDVNPLQTLFFKKKPVESNIDIPGCSKDTGQCDSSSSEVVSKSDLAVKILDAEIRWAIKVVKMHASYRSTVDISKLFAAMFSDSDIALGFQMSKTKVSYMIGFGLSDYFYKTLVNNVKQSPFYSVLFDESLNEVLNKEQMDLQLRFFDNVKGEVITRYFDSRFVYRPNAVNLTNEIIDSIKEFDAIKMTMLGMDGPNVNWAIFEKVNKERETHEHPPLHNIGSCGLHSIHGAFESGILAVDWEIHKILKSMFKLFHKSPARRDLYLSASSLNIFPKRYFFYFFMI